MILWNLDHKRLCDLFEEEGLELLKLFYRNGLKRESVNISIFSESCSRGNMKFVKFLVENGTNIDGNDGTPLKLAIENDRLDIVEHLIRNGANAHSSSMML
ncbi:hypothetical protein BB558_007417 [Smittium angustum]|uniref:Uncharacterized protein n=1 Tax=Smittium angustum TaxID=133377 RepID=A0A2U1IV27_SMIAN|nr:hypothetical protein BB558_007417 [Smittium angustum]